MKKILQILAFFLLLACFGCASKVPVTYQPLQPTTLSGEKALELLIETVTEFYPEGVIENHKTGQIISSKNITDECWAGLFYGGFVPCKADRFVANVISMEPFEVTIAVEEMRSGSFSAYRDWETVGVNEGKRKMIYEKLQTKLYWK